MRRGLMKWREDELSAGDVAGRLARLRAGMAQQGLDAYLAYTTLVRPAGVQYLTGFTPYWSDGLLLVTPSGAPVFVTALSKRVGQWLSGVNPTAQIMHAPSPGRKIGELLAQMQVARLGVLELDMMPGALVQDLTEAAPAVELVDAGDVFAAARAVPTDGETRLAARAEALARDAFGKISANAATVGEVVGPLEREVRAAGAEECYIAIAPDLSNGTDLARRHGDEALGDIFAARVSVAYNGVWTRLTRTLNRGAAYGEEISMPLQHMAARLDLSAPLQAQVEAAAASANVELVSWMLEAPSGTRPLKRVAGPGQALHTAIPYGVLSLSGRSGGAPFLFSTLVSAHAERRAA